MPYTKIRLKYYQINYLKSTNKMPCLKQGIDNTCFTDEHRLQNNSLIPDHENWGPFPVNCELYSAA